MTEYRYRMFVEVYYKLHLVQLLLKELTHSEGNSQEQHWLQDKRDDFWGKFGPHLLKNLPVKILGLGLELSAFCQICNTNYLSGLMTLERICKIMSGQMASHTKSLPAIRSMRSCHLVFTIRCGRPGDQCQWNLGCCQGVMSVLPIYYCWPEGECSSRRNSGEGSRGPWPLWWTMLLTRDQEAIMFIGQLHANRVFFILMSNTIFGPIIISASPDYHIMCCEWLPQHHLKNSPNHYVHRTITSTSSEEQSKSLLGIK